MRRLRPDLLELPQVPQPDLLRVLQLVQPARPGRVDVQVNVAPVPAVVASPLKLVGIAEDTSDDGVVRTAIVSGYGDLFLVKEGESVTLRYRVSRVLSDLVELVDVTDQTTLRLAIQ